jgi:hypothetical protein
VRLEADANVLLSIAMGGAAAKLVTRPDFELFTTRHTFAETLEYLLILAARKGLSLERRMLICSPSNLGDDLVVERPARYR